MTKETNQKKLPNTGIAHRVLLRPRMTEKAHTLLSLGQYVFQVAPRATKKEVKQAIEDIYRVTVRQVNMIRIPRKRKMFGRVPGWKQAIKKAVVTLKKGESIELFKGV